MICGWCGTTGDAKRCARCGHRADLPRAICDCGICAARRLRGEEIEWTRRDREDVTRYASDRIARAVAGQIRGSASQEAARRLGLLTYEEWLRRYRRHVNADPILHRSFKALSLFGVDPNEVLRRGYQAARDGDGRR